MHRFADDPWNQASQTAPGQLRFLRRLGSCLNAGAWLLMPLTVAGLALAIFLFFSIG